MIRLRTRLIIPAFLLCLGTIVQSQEPAIAAKPNPFTALMQQAAAHASRNGAKVPPVLSPSDATVLSGEVDVPALHAMGVRVISWTTNDPDKMRALLALRVDGIISDRPDILHRVVAEERAKAGPAGAGYFERLDLAGHRGGRGLRPENTLPAFEAGLDNLVGTLETDTGVTTDHVSLIWHDQFLNPLSCRRADGKPYTLDNRAYTRDLSSKDAQSTFVCDKLKLTLFPDQRNDLALSPVAVAFAAKEHLTSPYAPTYAEQLFRFVAFYVDYYRNGAGKFQPEAAARAANAAKVRFNLETKILPDMPAVDGEAADPAESKKNHTVDPEVFVEVLCGAILRNHMEKRAEVQSFDFRTLQLVEERYPQIPTYYLTDEIETLSSPLLPATLRQP